MSKRAEQKAIERYPITAENGERAFLARSYFVKGYEQAQKDLELTREKVQDIWFITDRLLHSIPEDFNKWEEWMFNTSGRFTKALEEINKYWESKEQ